MFSAGVQLRFVIQISAFKKTFFFILACTTVKANSLLSNNLEKYTTFQIFSLTSEVIWGMIFHPKESLTSYLFLSQTAVSFKRTNSHHLYTFIGIKNVSIHKILHFDLTVTAVLEDSWLSYNTRK